MELRIVEVADGQLLDELVTVQRRAYRVEADLIGDDRIPPLHETADDVRRCGETFLGAFVDGRLAGFVSWKRLGAALDIHRLAVDPSYARRGVGRALVRAAQTAEPEAAEVAVETASANGPARALYRSEGFAETGEWEAEPGLPVVQLRRRRGR